MNFLTKSGRVSARKQIQIREITDGILVLPNNEYRLIMETSSVNFELKSEEEQDVMIDSFQNFLNALPCHIQILIRVREVDVDRYVEGLEETKAKETETLYRQQIDSYGAFVKKLVSGNKILSRRFYIVIPYHHTDRVQDMALIKEHLYLNRDIVIRGLERMSMKAWELSSMEVLNLFYSFYNPESVKTQQLTKETISALTHYTYV